MRQEYKKFTKVKQQLQTGMSVTLEKLKKNKKKTHTDKHTKWVIPRTSRPVSRLTGSAKKLTFKSKGLNSPRSIRAKIILSFSRYFSATVRKIGCKLRQCTRNEIKIKHNDYF